MYIHIQYINLNIINTKKTSKVSIKNIIISNRNCVHGRFCVKKYLNIFEVKNNKSKLQHPYFFFNKLKEWRLSSITWAREKRKLLVTIVWAVRNITSAKKKRDRGRLLVIFWHIKNRLFLNLLKITSCVTNLFCSSSRLCLSWKFSLLFSMIEKNSGGYNAKGFIPSTK